MKRFMNPQIELKLLKEIEELRKDVNLLKGIDTNQPPTYQYIKIKDTTLKALFNIAKKLDNSIFEEWFNSPIVIDNAVESFLAALITKNQFLVESYNEEDLKVYYIIPLLNKIDFMLKDEGIRGFYELPMSYVTDEFILNGTCDFVVSEGLIDSKKPYFFIQEFKKHEEYNNPRPQLLAELITAVELNSWKFIKGAYITGCNWHFVILERLALHQYQYSISQQFDATKLEDLKSIYKHLLFVKNEIIRAVGAIRLR